MQVEYKDHVIEVGSDLKFRVKGPEFEGRSDLEFDSKIEAVKAIDSRISIAEKQKRVASVTQLSAIHAETGEVFTIRGINRANRNVLGLPAGSERHHYRRWEVFPNVPWIKDLILKRRDLLKQAYEIDRRLAPYGLSDRSGYGRLSAENYDAVVNQYVAEFKAKEAKAIEDAPTE